MPGTRLVVVDDAERVRQDLCQMLSLCCDVEIVGQAANGLQAVDLVQALHPEAILMDLEMPVMDGYTATQMIKSFYPECRIIAFTVHGYKEAQDKAFKAGVDSFVVKGEPVENLVQAITQIRSL